MDCINCTEYFCTDYSHIVGIQNFHDSLIASCIEASKVIPVSKKSKKIPGWNEYVERHKQTSQFWHFIWKERGSPPHGEIAQIMRSTRSKYHYAIRYVKKSEEMLRKNAMAKSISENNSRDLWKEVYKVRSKCKTSSQCMDDVSGIESISELFAHKYNVLYNSVCSNTTQLNELLALNENDIITNCSNNNTSLINKHTHHVSVDQLQNAIHKLKSSKSDCTDQLFSDHFINGTLRFFTLISLLFTSMLSHGVAPTGLLLSTMVPVPKDKRGSKSGSNNYRAIAISSILGKLFDSIIIKDQHLSLITDDLQFGFNENSSTITCTQLLVETIEYYNINNTDCYMLLLDASKAFDRIEYVRLFKLLRERNICPIVLRLIIAMYISQMMQVRWGEILSKQFPVGNGVKQGGVLSPVLFTVYIDNLLKTLKQRNIGSKIGNSYLGVFGYADDLTLLCPSLTGLKEMLNTCEAYAKDYNILFNAKKSKLMYFGRNNINTNNMMSMSNGTRIDFVEQCTHLGTIIYSDIRRKNVDFAVNDLFMRTNNLMADFSYTHSSTLSVLYNSYCMNVYGSQLWCFNDHKSINRFYVAWRKTIRRIWHIDKRTHNSLLHTINNCLPIDLLLEKRCIKFIWNLFNSAYELHKSIIRGSFYNKGSSIAENIRYFMYKYSISMYDGEKPLNVLMKKVYNYASLHSNVDDICTATALVDLCRDRDNHRYDVFTHSDIIDIIQMLCTC